jgi:DNA polymerase bacteriophage-type
MPVKFQNIDALVHFVDERVHIRLQKEADQPRPWTTDPLLGTYSFCNADVQDDRVSRVIFDTIARPYREHPHLIVGLAVCRFTNEPAVIEAVQNCIVPFNAERFVAIMEDRKARGLSLSRRAYVIPGGRKGELKAASLARDLFTPLANSVEAIRPKLGDSCAAVFERLRAFPYLDAGFITAQVVRDLKQVEPLRSAPDWKTFVRSGPGSQRGVNRILGATTPAEIDRLRPEAEWRALFEQIVALAAPRVAELGIELDAQSWQNCICETDKWLRFKSGDLRGARSFKTGGETPTRSRRRAEPTSPPVEAPIDSVEPTPPAPHALPELAAARDPSAPHTLHHDLETRSAVDLKAAGAHRYAADPTTEVLCIAYAVDDEPVQLWTPGDPVPSEFTEAASNPSWTAVAHNDDFERAIAQHVLEPRHGFPSIPIERRRCSMATALAAALPGKLEGAVEALGLPHAKDKEGAALMRRISRPLPGGGWTDDPASRERLYLYCRRDVEAERALFRALPPLTDAEQKLWELDAAINARGFYTDSALLDAAHNVAAKAEASLQTEFRELTGLNSTNQVEKFVAWLAEHGCVVSDVRKGTLKSALRRKGLEPAVRRAVELRLQLAHASATKVEALLAWRGNDGRVRGTLRFHGAATGRWTGHGPQPQNFKRDAEGVDAKIAAVMNGGAGLASPVEAVGEVARATICAAPGHRLMIADFSGVESRVLAWISGQQSKADAWARFDRTRRTEDDPYVRIAERCGLTGEGARDVGKRIDLAFGFGGSVGAWERSAPEDDTTDEKTARRYQQTWRAEHPDTVRFWYALDRAATSAIRRPGIAFPVRRVAYNYDDPFLQLTLPAGRAISYPFARIEGQDRSGRPQLTFLDNAGGKFAECRFGQGCWFGMLVENIVQATARDLLAAAMVRLEAAGYPTILHVHDEIIVEVPDGFGSLDEFRALVTAVPDWAAGLPVAAKAREGMRFSKPDAAPPTSAPPPQNDTPVAGEGDESARNSSTIAPETATEAGAAPSPEAIVRPVEAKSNGAGNEQRAGNGPGQSGDGQDRGDYGDRTSEECAGKPYGPIRTALMAKGYQIAKTFPFAVPGEAAPLFYEDRYELRPGLTPTKERPRKTSRYRHPANGQELSDTGPRRIIYNWPAIMAAGPGATVFVVEGANKAEPLNRAGLLATAAPYHQWGPECAAALTGRHIFYLEDHDHADENGRIKAKELSADARRKLAPVAASIRVVPAMVLWKDHRREGEPPHGWDVKNWLETGGDPTQLLDICRAIPADGAGLTFIDMSKWDFEPTPEQEWVVYNRVPRRECVLFSGIGGSGKSITQLYLSVASVLARDWLGVAPEQGPAIFIDAEDDEKVLHRRLKAIAEHYDASITEMTKRGLHLVSWRGRDAVLGVPARNGKIEPTPLYSELLQAAGDIKPILIGIAASANVFAGNENDRAQVQQFIGLLTKVAMTANGTVALISHPSVAGISTESGLSGSTQWHNSVRARYFMREVKPEAGEPLDTDLRELVFKKNNYGSISESIVLRWSNGLFLPASGAPLDQAAKEAVAEEVFLALLGRFRAVNRHVSDRTGTNYAPALFAVEREASGAGLSKEDLKRAMRRLFQRNAIWNEPCGKPSRPSYRIAPKA